MNHGYEASLVKRVVNQLVASIVNGEYQDHVLPPQVLLSKKHGVSRTIMREALSVLISRRMLDVRPKTGTRIKPVSEWLVMDAEVAEWRLRVQPDPDFVRRLMEFRTLVDPPAAALASTRANRHQRIAINGAFQKLLHTSPTEPLQSTAEDALQAAIVDASGDELLRQMGCVVRIGIKTMKATLRTQPHALPRVSESQLGEYGRLVRAIELNDSDAAREAMTQVLARSASLWTEELV